MWDGDSALQVRWGACLWRAQLPPTLSREKREPKEMRRNLASSPRKRATTCSASSRRWSAPPFWWPCTHTPHSWLQLRRACHRGCALFFSPLGGTQRV